MTTRLKAINELKKDSSIKWVSFVQFKLLREKLGHNTIYNKITHSLYPKTYFIGIQYRRKLYVPEEIK